MTLLSELAAMRGAEMLAAGIDVLRDEAAGIEFRQDLLVRLGFREQWEDGEKTTCAVLRAFADLGECIRAYGVNAQERDVKLSPVVIAGVDRFRSTLTMEAQARQTGVAPVAATPIKEEEGIAA